MPVSPLLQLAADLASLPEVAAAALLASAAQRDRTLRPLPYLLGGDVLCDVAQRLLAIAYAGPAPYQGRDLALYQVAQAAHLAWPAGALGLALWAFAAPRAAWLALPAWMLAVVAGLAVGQPPSGADSPIYLAAQVVAVVAGLAVWRGRRRPGLLAGCALIVLLGELAVLFAPYLVAPLLGVQASHAWAFALVPRWAVWLSLCVVGWPTWRPSSS